MARQLRGRPTKKGALCVRPPVMGQLTCYGHLDLNSQRARIAAQVPEAPESATPACHTWAAPDPDRRLFEWHAGRCAICGSPNGTVEDHCHRSGLVRGLLCHRCNTREGRSNAPIIRAYRLRPPAVMVGWTIEYDGGWGATGEPEQWVVDALGPVPDDLHEAAGYLAAAARLTRPCMRPEDNPLRRMGL